MSLQQETSVVQSIFGHLLNSDQNYDRVVKTLLNAASHSWRTQAPEVVVRNPEKDIIYVNAGAAWDINGEKSITTQEFLNDDITLFLIQDLSYWICEDWNFDSVEEFSEIDLAEAIGEFVLEFVQKQNFFSRLQFEDNQLASADGLQITLGGRHMGTRETVVTFPLNIRDLLAHLVANKVFPEKILEEYEQESLVHYGPKCPRGVRLEEDSEGTYFVVKNTSEVIQDYISDSGRANTLAFKVATLSKNKERLLKNHKFLNALTSMTDNNFLHHQVSTILVKHNEEAIYSLEEVKKAAWLELIKTLDKMMDEEIPDYKSSKWSQDVIKQLIPYSSTESLLVTHNKSGKEISFKQDPEQKYIDWLKPTGITKFKVKVNCVLVDTAKVLEFIKQA